MSPVEKDYSKLKIVPNHYRMKYGPEDIKPIPFHWRRPAGFECMFALRDVERYLKSLARHFQLDAQEVRDLYFSPGITLHEEIAQKGILDTPHFVKTSPYGDSIMFKTEEDGHAFVRKLNAVMLDPVNENLDNLIKVKLLLAGEKLEEAAYKREYRNGSVILVSPYLAKHFQQTLNTRYMFRTLKLEEISKEGPFSFQAKVTLYTEISGNCNICSRTLDDPFSQAVGIGPVCAKKIGFKNVSGERVPDKSVIEEIRKKIREIAESVGVLDVFVFKDYAKKLKY